MLYSKTKSFFLQTVSTLDRTTNINNTLSISRVTHIFVTVTTRFLPFMATVFFLPELSFETDALLVVVWNYRVKLLTVENINVFVIKNKI